MTIWFRFLDKHFKEALYSRSISLESLREIHAKMEKDNNTKKKTIKIIAIVLVAVMIFMAFSTFMNDKDFGLFLMISCFGSIISLLICGFIYFCLLGIFNMQYNKAIKECYPDLYEELKL